MAKTVPAVATAIGVALVITGAVLFLGREERSGATEPAVAQVLPSAPVSTGGTLPDLSAFDREKTVRRAAASDAATAPAAPKPAADRLALPAVPASRAWDGLFNAADDLASGAITQEGVVNLALDLLAQLPADAVPQVSHGLATYDLLDSPGVGKVQLVVNLENATDGAKDAAHPSAFAINAVLETRPGAFTGNAADNAKSTSLAITVQADDHDALQSVSASSQNIVAGSQELWAQMSGAGQAAVIGGVFSITDESSTWLPLTVTASGSADKPGFLHAMGDPIEKPGQLADPRTQFLNEVLASRRKHAPR